MANIQIKDLIQLSNLLRLDIIHVGKDSDNKDYFITKEDMIGRFPAWDTGTTYAVNDFIVYSGKIYLSLQAANVGKQPDSEPTWWQEFTSGGGLSSLWIPLPAGSWNYPNSNPMPLDQDVGSNKEIYRHLGDDTTEEFIDRSLPLPNEIDAAGTVDLYIWVYAKTWVTGKNVQLKWYHGAIGNNEDWDAAMSSKLSGDQALSTTGQNYLTRIKISETISNLNWSSLDTVDLQVSRVAPGSNNLVGDLGIHNAGILIPRA